MIPTLVPYIFDNYMSYGVWMYLNTGITVNFNPVSIIKFHYENKAYCEMECKYITESIYYTCYFCYYFYYIIPY